MTRRQAVAGGFAAVASAAAVAACGSSSSGSVGGGGGATPASLAPSHGSYSPRIDPSEFSSAIDNPFFPLRVGANFHLAGTAENGRTPQADVSVVTGRTRTILGVKSRAVRDTVLERGRPIERTIDYYAQDRRGNVWYMGERSLDRQGGRFVKGSDSWLAGVSGAQPGIIMPAQPAPSGGSYRQEYYPGHAMDQARVIGSGGTLQTPAGTFRHTLTTVESSVLEPGLREQKWYEHGIGEIKEAVVKGNREHFTLTAYRR